MKKILALSTLAVGATLAQRSFAQQVPQVNRPGMTIDVGNRNGGRNGGETAGNANKGPRGGSPAGAISDPYPALTAANNAYNRSVAEWQHANQDYLQALKEQKEIRDKYVDQDNHVRPGWDYDSVVTVVHAADVKAEDALVELQRKERERNEAASRAGDAFKQASEQYSRSVNAERSAAQQQQNNRQNSSPSENHDPHQGGKGGKG